MNVHEIAVVEVEEAPSPMHSHLADIKESMEKNQNFYSNPERYIITNQQRILTLCKGSRVTCANTSSVSGSACDNSHTN
jgi:hypothetical protein